MADGVKLVLGFGTDEGGSASYTFNHTKENVSLAQVKNLMDTMIANSSTYEDTLIAKKSAKTVVTTETVYDLSA